MGTVVVCVWPREAEVGGKKASISVPEKTYTFIRFAYVCMYVYIYTYLLLLLFLIYLIFPRNSQPE